jgi:tetratricopeptide (TPR) repeat protein
LRVSLRNFDAIVYSLQAWEEGVMSRGEQKMENVEIPNPELLRLGKEALRLRNYPAARRYLEQALHKERSPEHLSLYALALAHQTGNTHAAIALCQEALRKDSKNQEHFLRLGTIYLIAGRRKEAIRIFHLGLRLGRHQGIARMLQAMGHRQKPVLPFLARSNPLNRYLGKIRMNIRKNR